MKNCKPKSFKTYLHRLVPISEWLPAYKWKEDLTNDLIAGITIAIMQIPQGMAYALLAEVPPVLGIYAAVFPVLAYAIFGPSKHISVGTTSLTCMLAAGTVTKLGVFENVSPGNYSISPSAPWNSTADVPSSDENFISYTSTEVIMAICFMCGVWQLFLGLIGFGKLAWIMSEVFMSGFTTGAAIHVFTSQVKGAFGLRIPGHRGPLKLIYIYVDIYKALLRTNPVSLAICITSIVCIVINNEIIKPRLVKICAFPIPIQLIVVIAGISCSYFFNFSENYNVDIVGHVPNGLPKPYSPPMNLIAEVWLNSLIIAVVGYCLCLSMAKIFANKFNYKVSGSQEMLSEGISNLFASFFCCVPAATALSRSLVQVNVGGKTQLTSIISAFLLILTLLFVGPLLQPLPKACLSAIVIVALKGMFMQAGDLIKYWKNCKMDGLLWLATFLAIVLLDIDIGLGVGLVLNIFMVFYHGFKIEVSLRTTKSQELAVESHSNVEVIDIAGSLTFANFESTLKKLDRIASEKFQISASSSPSPPPATKILCDLKKLKWLDQTAGKHLKLWIEKANSSFEKSHSRILINEPNDQVREMLKKLNVDEELIVQMSSDLQTTCDNFKVEEKQE